MSSRKTLVLLAVLLSPVVLRAAETAPLQLSVVPDLALHPRNTKIEGLCLSAWGENPFRGVALGFVNGASGESVGLGYGLLNYSQRFSGASLGWVNVNAEYFVGWQAGFVNVSRGEFTGLQSGWFNYARVCRGVQFGFVNYAESLHGVQIGLANVAMNNAWFEEFPRQWAKGFALVNWSF